MKTSPPKDQNLDGVSKVIDERTGREYEPGEYTKRQRDRKSSRERRRFIMGPISVAWIGSVFRLRKPSAAKVAVALYYQRGLCKSTQFKVEPARFRELGINDTARRRGLSELEKAGLIEVKHRPGQSPVVTMINSEIKIKNKGNIQ